MADPSDGRRFNREETAFILRRATEGERRLETRIESGLTLDEIVLAARDAGIDIAAVRRAATITPAPSDPLQAWLVAAPVNPVVQGLFPGRLPPARMGAARTPIESSLGRKGELVAEPTGFVWREDHGFGRTWVRAHSDGLTVEVTGEAQRKGHLLALMLGLATLVALVLLPLGGFAGLAALVGPLLAVLAPVGAVLIGTRLVWPALQRPVIRRLEAAVLEVGALVEEQGPEGSS